MVLSDLFDDDGPTVPPPPSVEMPPPAMLAGAEMWRRWQTCEAMVAVPETAWATPTAAAKMTTIVPNTVWVMLVVAAEVAS